MNFTYALPAARWGRSSGTSESSMIYVAQIEEGIVRQVIVASEDHEPDPSWAIVGPENTVGIGGI